MTDYHARQPAAADRMPPIRPSFAVSTFNRRNMVLEAVESALAKNRADQEIIVVDDGSTDDTLQVLATFAGRIRIQRQENAGAGRPATAASPPPAAGYVTFLDSDDL